jgi:hypothetical protein
MLINSFTPARTVKDRSDRPYPVDATPRATARDANVWRFLRCALARMGSMGPPAVTAPLVLPCFIGSGLDRTCRAIAGPEWIFDRTVSRLASTAPISVPAWSNRWPAGGQRRWVPDGTMIPWSSDLVADEPRLACRSKRSRRRAASPNWQMPWRPGRRRTQALAESMIAAPVGMRLYRPDHDRRVQSASAHLTLSPLPDCLNEWCYAALSRRWDSNMRMTTITLLITMLPLNSYAAPLIDPNLPSVKPEALQQLTDNRVRQRIMQESKSLYSGRCVCQYQTKDSHGRSCKGRHEVIRTKPQPLCYPSQVTSEMVSDWRQRHP